MDKDNNKEIVFTVTQKQAMIVVGLLMYAWGRKVGYTYGHQTAIQDIKSLVPPL